MTALTLDATRRMQMAINIAVIAHSAVQATRIGLRMMPDVSGEFAVISKPLRGIKC